jgi:hypothetical protein
MQVSVFAFVNFCVSLCLMYLSFFTCHLRSLQWNIFAHLYVTCGKNHVDILNLIDTP